MTCTRYMQELLDSMTVEHVDKYVAAIRNAEASGRPRAGVINVHFDTLSLDLEYRFQQTIGAVKALHELSKGAPEEKQIEALLTRAHDDFDHMVNRMADRDLRRNRRGNDHNTVCRSIAKRSETSCAVWRSPCLEIAPAITARIALDYELVAEQFRDFLHDGSTVLDFGDKDEKPKAAAA